MLGLVTIPAFAQFRIALTGDVVMALNYPSERTAPEDGAHLFDSVRPYLESADVAMANLEGLFLDKGGTITKKLDLATTFLFRMPQRYAARLKDAGYDVMSISNNHIRDFDMEGIDTTMAVLSRAGIAYAGVLERCEKTVFVRNGVKYGFCAFSPHDFMCDINDWDYAAYVIRSLREDDGCDIVIVSFHGGAEGVSATHVPRKMEIYIGEHRGDVHGFAHHCIDAGADLIFGHGPHVLRGVEMYKGRFIAYSLGNFCTPFGCRISGRLGYAPVILVDINRRGEFVRGKIISNIQRGVNGPVPDESGLCIKELKYLSETDFPESRLVIDNDGTIRRL